MVSFDLSFRSMLTEEIVEDEGAIWTEVSISWISINRVYYHDKRVQFVDGSFRPCICVGVLSGEGYPWEGSRSVSGVCFFCFWIKQNSNPQKQDRMQT